MKIQKSFKMAVNILVHSKTRSWLTIIGIIIGVAAIVAIVSIGTGLQETVRGQLGDLGADVITVTPGFSRATGFGPMDQSVSITDETILTSNDVQILKGIPGIDFINPAISGSTDVSYLGETTKVTTQGVDPLAWSQIITSDVLSGRLLGPGDTNAVVLTEGLATEVFDNEILVGKQVTINDRLFRVIGILESSGFGGNTIYISMFMARNIIEDKEANEFDFIAIKLSESQDVDLITEEIEKKLLLSHHVTRNNQDFTVTSSKALQEQINQILGTFTLFLTGIAGVSLLVGAVGIANTMFTSVLEKTKDIGIMKSIGARNSDVLSIFLINSGLVGLVGGVIGIIFGVVGSALLGYIIPSNGPAGAGITPLVTIDIIAIALFVSFGIGIISGTIPAYRASKLKPVDALRYE
ncbi:ABC transporter permease [Candidatus Aenigmatarchaeota archaeon]